MSALFYLPFSAAVDMFDAPLLIVNNVADTLCAQIPLSSAAFLFEENLSRRSLQLHPVCVAAFLFSSHLLFISSEAHQDPVPLAQENEKLGSLHRHPCY